MTPGAKQDAFGHVQSRSAEYLPAPFQAIALDGIVHRPPRGGHYDVAGQLGNLVAAGVHIGKQGLAMHHTQGLAGESLRVHPAEDYGSHPLFRGGTGKAGIGLWNRLHGE